MIATRLEDGTFASSPIFVGAAPVPAACAEGDHAWEEEEGSAPANEGGLVTWTERCGRCRWIRARWREAAS